jgi:hypothetical protein
MKTSPSTHELSVQKRLDAIKLKPALERTLEALASYQDQRQTSNLAARQA